MTPDMMLKLRRSLVEHEGYRKFPYLDSLGKITIGIGYNLTDRGIEDDWINERFQADSLYFYNQLSTTFPWFVELNIDRQIVLIDMSFMGWQHFLEFENMFRSLSHHDYKQAAFEMLDSKWASQVKCRAAALAQGMLTGVYSI